MQERLISMFRRYYAAPLLGVEFVVEDLVRACVYARVGGSKRRERLSGRGGES